MTIGNKGMRSEGMDMVGSFGSNEVEEDGVD